MAVKGPPTTDRLRRQSRTSVPAPSSIGSVPVERPRDKTDIYLDYAATTPVDPAVVGVMTDFFTVDGVFGNPASQTHGFGQAAAEAVEGARREVAALLSSKAEEIVWTSGATEAINLALKGAALARRSRGRHVVTSPLEHRAVLDSAKWLESQGFEIGYVEPDSEGAITPENLSRALRTDTVVVSLMLVNNETGAVTDIAELGPVVHRQGALLHIDAVQGAARLPLDDAAAEADLISISAHKMYGPKGIGALRVRTSLRGELVPQIHGGGQEFGLRSGTLATHQIAGMGEAARLVRDQRTAGREPCRGPRSPASCTSRRDPGSRSERQLPRARSWHSQRPFCRRGGRVTNARARERCDLFWVGLHIRRRRALPRFACARSLPRTGAVIREIQLRSLYDDGRNRSRRPVGAGDCDRSSETRQMIPSASSPVAVETLPERLDAIRHVLQMEYRKRHGYPWIVAYSGGKDSTLLLQLVWESVVELPAEARKRPVIVVGNDTLVESPMVIRPPPGVARGDWLSRGTTGASDRDRDYRALH